MVDLEQAYDYESAVELGRAFSEMPCDWLEGPLDVSIDAFAELRRAVDVDIILAGNTVAELSAMADVVARSAWSKYGCFNPIRIEAAGCVRADLVRDCGRGDRWEILE